MKLKLYRKSQGNDTPILFGIILLLSILAFVMPYIVNEFSKNPVSRYDIQQTKSQVQSETESSSFFGFITGSAKVISSIIKIFIWNWDIPFWIEVTYFTPIRILGYYILIRLLRGVG